MTQISPIFAIDGYKLSHRVQYPEGTSFVYGNFTPRSNKHFKTPVFEDPMLLMAGTQAFIKSWLIDAFDRDFFNVKKEHIVDKFKLIVDGYLGPNAVSVDGIEALWDLGYLPLMIKAVPEGHLVQMKMPVLTIKNTKPEFFWLVNYLETLLSAELWPVATAATIAFNYRVLCERWAKLTCDDNNHIQWQCHDFAARGNMGINANSLTGLGHLCSFTGTDSVFALVRAQEQYAVNDSYLYGGSVPATEHSVMCMGTQESEIDTFKRLITELYPSGIVSIVSDTWDYWQVITKFLPDLKQDIMNRDGKVVIRPDSGDPIHIIAGYYIEEFESQEDYASKGLHVKTEVAYFKDSKKYYKIEWDGRFSCEKLVKISEEEAHGTITKMWEIFGGQANKKGFKVLDSHIGLIYGDSITLERADEILRRLRDKGFASSNVVFGIGSFTYQYNTRDTFGFAVKATYGVVNGEGRAIQKDPKTDDGTKKSLKGLLRHFFNDGIWTVRDETTFIDEQNSDLATVFLDGNIITETTLAAIRENVDSYVKRMI